MLMIKRKNLYIFLIFLLPIFTVAQDDDSFHPPNHNSNPTSPKQKGFSWDRVFTGGNIGLAFGSQIYISATPTLGYKITDRFLAGVNFNYTYFKDNIIKYQTSSYGIGPFARYHIFENIFVHAEYEVLNFEPAFIDNTGSIFILPRRWVPSLFVGGGYRQRIGTNSSFNILILFNVLDNLYSPYTNPVIRMGFNIGL